LSVMTATRSRSAHRSSFVPVSMVISVVTSEFSHFFPRHSGMVRQHQTRNLEIPGSMRRIAPE
jgi:hypothetical protein